MKWFIFTIVTSQNNHVDYKFQASDEAEGKKYMHKLASELELSTRHFHAI